MAKMRESVRPRGTGKFAPHTYLAIDREATVSRPCVALAELKKQSIAKKDAHDVVAVGRRALRRPESGNEDARLMYCK